MRTVNDLHIHLDGLISMLLKCPLEIPQSVRSVLFDVRKGVLRIGRYLDPRSNKVVFFQNKGDVEHIIIKMNQLRGIFIRFLVHALPKESMHELDTLNEFITYSILFLGKRL